MKKSKLLVIAALVSSLCASLAVVSACAPEHTHTFEGAEWTITKEPTLTTGGTAERKCTANDDGVDTKDLPALTDASVWTKDTAKSTPATHTAGGKDVYTSVYGDVEVDTPKDPNHTYDGVEWEITQEPTLTAGGKAQRSCTANDYVDKVDLPALNDTDVWTKDTEHSTPATHTAKGTDVYTSVYGKVEVETEKDPNHVYDGVEWEITQEPTLTAGGKAQRSCTANDYVDEVDIPALNNTDVWTKDTEHSTAADYNHGGSTVYTSEYGSVTVTSPKLIAPYDGKTYGSVAIEAMENGKIKNNPAITTSWTEARLTLDANGVGSGTGYPFSLNEKISIRMVNSATGAIEIDFVDGTWAEGDDGSVFTPDTPEKKETLKGYVNMTTGYIIMFEANGRIELIMPESDVATSYTEACKVSAWGTNSIDYSVALSYTVGEKTHTFFIDSDVVYFDVTFTDLDGEDVAANDCFESNALYVTTKDGEVLHSLGFDGKDMVGLDGYEGTYTLAEHDDLFLSGLGKAKLGADEGTYTDLGGGKIGLLLDKGEYYETTVDKAAKTYTAPEAIKVTVTLDYGTVLGQDNEDKEYFKNVPVDLPEPTAENNTHSFVGWFTDEECETEVTLNDDGKFVPTENTTLYAKWLANYHVSFKVEGKEGDAIDLYGRADEDIREIAMEYLKANVVEGDFIDDVYDVDGNRILDDIFFVGDSSDSTLTNVTFGDLEDRSDTLVIYAVWKVAPAYVGDFNGANLDGAADEDSVSTSYHIAISYDGKISGKYTGTVQSYNKETQLITFLSGSTTNYLFFDEETGILVTGNYYNATYTYITHDIVVFSKNNMSTFAHRAINVPNPSSPSSTSQGVYARFVEAVKADGTTVTILLYNTSIYNDITITDSLGNPLATLDAIGASKTITVTDNKTHTIILQRATAGTSLASGNTKELDAYFGTYLKDSADTLALDGAGTAKWGDRDGTYVAVSDTVVGAHFTVEEKDTYYEFTLNKAAKSYTETKTMVTVTLHSEHGDVSAFEASNNKDVEVELPTPTDADYVFRGWFSNESCAEGTELDKNEDGNYIFTPTADVTIYAKWLARVTVTAHFNDDDTTEDAVTNTLGVGETFTIARPAFAGHRFLGWFTDDTTFQTTFGTYDADTGITTIELEETTYDIYANWGDPYAFSGEYKLYYFGKDGDPGTETSKDYSVNIVIEPDGFIAATDDTEYPFDNNYGGMRFSSYDEGTGKIVYTVKSSYSGSINAWYDAESGYLVFLRTESSLLDNASVLVPVDDTVTVTSSYWNRGNTRAISLAKAGSSVGVFVDNGEAYIGVTFTDIKGTEVAAENAYNATFLNVKKGDEVIESYASNGTKLVKTDGYEGEYTKAEGSEFDLGTLTLNGAGLVTSSDETSGTYTLVVGKDYTADLYLDNVFYYLTLTLDTATHTYSVVKPMATVTYDLDGKTAADFETTEQRNLNTQYVLEDPVVEGYIFRGWYTKNDFYDSSRLSKNDEGKYVYTPKEMNVTLYAYLLKEVTITIHYDKGDLDDVTVTLGEGETVGNLVREGLIDWPGDPAVQDVEGKHYRFDGWFSDASYESEWDNSHVIREDTDLYAKWVEVPDVEYVIAETYPWTQDEDAGTWTSGNNKRNSSSSILTINFYTEGTFSFHWFVSSEGGSCDYLTIEFTHDGSTETPVEQQGGHDGDEKQDDLEVEVVAGDSLKLTYRKDSSSNYGEDLARISNIVWTKAAPPDGLEGTYNGNKGETAAAFTVNGRGKVTDWGGRTGFYTAHEDNANVLDVVLSATDTAVEERWTVTLVTDGDTYTAVMPMTNVTFVIDDNSLTHDGMPFNTGVNATLPDVESDTKYVESWYTSADRGDESLVADGQFTPTGDAMTFYGKAANKLTVTLHPNGHGTGGDTVLYFKKGATPDLTANKLADDTSGDKTFYFTGWFTEAACTTAYVPAPLEESIELYAGWSDAAYTIEITNAEGSKQWQLQDDGTYHVDAGSAAKAYIKITFKASGSFSFDWTCQYADADDWGNSLFVTINKDPKSAYGSDKKFTAQTGSGVGQKFDVKAGDVLYIASMVYAGPTSGDFATVSNFTFVAG